MELIVVGFHRSGTSLLTQLLRSAGLYVGDNLLGALPTNPYGHFEDREVLELHREIMQNNGPSWHVDTAPAFYISPAQWARMESFVARRKAMQVTWGFKDPRVCFFLGAWKFLLPSAKFVMVYRDPAECVRSMNTRHARAWFDHVEPVSLHRRFFVSADHGLKLWHQYNRAMIAFARAHLDDCLLIDFREIEHGYPVVRTINERFGAGLDEIPTEAVFDAAVTGRRSYPLVVHDPAVTARVKATWDSLEALALRYGAPT